MKFYNKNPKYRRTWTPVVIKNKSIKKLKRWCQNQDGERFFYTNEYDSMISWTLTFLFESPEDAIRFKLING